MPGLRVRTRLGLNDDQSEQPANRGGKYRSGNAAGRGALLGTAFGLAVAAIFYLPQEPSDDASRAQRFGVGAVLFAVPAALLGAAVGSGIDRWTSVAVNRCRLRPHADCPRCAAGRGPRTSVLRNRNVTILQTCASARSASSNRTTATLTLA
jgi:hypothetical protein